MVLVARLAAHVVCGGIGAARGVIKQVMKTLYYSTLTLLLVASLTALGLTTAALQLQVVGPTLLRPLAR